MPPRVRSDSSARREVGICSALERAEHSGLASKREQIRALGERLLWGHRSPGVWGLLIAAERARRASLSLDTHLGVKGADKRLGGASAPYMKSGRQAWSLPFGFPFWRCGGWEGGGVVVGRATVWWLVALASFNIVLKQF